MCPPCGNGPRRWTEPFDGPFVTSQRPGPTGEIPAGLLVYEIDLVSSEWHDVELQGVEVEDDGSP